MSKEKKTYIVLKDEEYTKGVRYPHTSIGVKDVLEKIDIYLENENTFSVEYEQLTDEEFEELPELF